MPDSGTPLHPRGTCDSLGICQWFHYEAYADVERAVLLHQEHGPLDVRVGLVVKPLADSQAEIGRASCRERV